MLRAGYTVEMHSYGKYLAADTCCSRWNICDKGFIENRLCIISRCFFVVKSRKFVATACYRSRRHALTCSQVPEASLHIRKP
jgi:hypothetical protein